MLVVMVGITAFTITFVAIAMDSKPVDPPPTLVVVSEGSAGASGKAYTVLQASPGLAWRDLVFILEGDPLEPVTGEGCPNPPAGAWVACGGGVVRAATDEVQAGDVLKIQGWPGARLRVVEVRTGHLVVNEALR